MKIAVLSCSLHPFSRSYVLAVDVVKRLEQLNATVELHDLREYDLDFYNDTTAHKTPDAKKIISVIDEASVVLMAVPIYNYDVNAVAKNLLELGLKAWNNKLVGFLCAAGGKGSYMSVMGTANSLMLDFRCLIIPRFVYANGSDFGEDRTEQMYVASETIQARLQELAETAVQLGTAIESTSS